LKLELLKANAQRASKTGNIKIREIKRTIARLLTILNQKNKKTQKEK